MIDWENQELVLRVGSFAVVFVAMALWELAAPRRPLVAGRGTRWVANLGLVALNTVIVRLIAPAAAVGGAWMAAERGWGLLNVVAVPSWVAIPLAVVVLDLALYVQHVVFHRVPVLWYLHSVHHADLDVDVTSGARFHPIEILISLVIKLAVVFALGAPALAVLIFEVLLNATAMFNHSNVRLLGAVDRIVRLVVVTPDMHRVHHSVERRECHANFGFNLPWWDRLFGTYEAQPGAGHEAMTLGLTHLQQARRQTLAWMLALPFRTDGGGYAGGGRRRP